MMMEMQSNSECLSQSDHCSVFIMHVTSSIHHQRSLNIHSQTNIFISRRSFLRHVTSLLTITAIITCKWKSNHLEIINYSNLEVYWPAPPEHRSPSERGSSNCTLRTTAGALMQDQKVNAPVCAFFIILWQKFLHQLIQFCKRTVIMIPLVFDGFTNQSRVTDEKNFIKKCCEFTSAHL